MPIADAPTPGPPVTFAVTVVVDPAAANATSDKEATAAFVSAATPSADTPDPEPPLTTTVTAVPGPAA